MLSTYTNPIAYVDLSLYYFKTKIAYDDISEKSILRWLIWYDIDIEPIYRYWW